MYPEKRRGIQQDRLSSIFCGYPESLSFCLGARQPTEIDEGQWHVEILVNDLLAVQSKACAPSLMPTKNL
jgi:hypothetical protein